MGRKRRRGRPLNGWLVIDKPAGMTSTAVVNEVRRITGAAKVGHGGTLDPMATGILPIAMGEATKTVAWAMEGEKTYRLTVRWGEATDTEDADGSVTETSDVRPDAAAIEVALPAFTGPIDQIPPAYSAVKVDGRRAYDVARNEGEPTLAPREVLIDALRLEGAPDADHATFVVRAGKGAYMRSLARDLARALGTVGHLSALRRTVVGPFTENQAISLDQLGALGHDAPSSEHFLPVEAALDDIPALTLTEAEARRLRSGQALPALPLAQRVPRGTVQPGATVRAMGDGRLVALARIEGGEVRPVRVMNL